jgi:hypothetical protein
MPSATEPSTKPKTAPDKTAAVKQRHPHYWVYVGALSIIVLVAGMMLWIGQKQPVKAEPPVAFFKVGPVLVQQERYLLSATIAIQTGYRDALWAQMNVDNFTAVLQHELNDVNPRTAQIRNGVDSLQGSLRETINGALKTTQVEHVWLTDFMYQSN